MREKVLELLLEVNEEIGDYQGENMLEDEVITSLELIEIVSAIEDEFGVTISAKNVSRQNFATVDSICDLIESLQK